MKNKSLLSSQNVKTKPRDYILVKEDPDMFTVSDVGDIVSDTAKEYIEWVNPIIRFSSFFGMQGATDEEQTKMWKEYSKERK